MDVGEILKREFFRPLVVTFIPGATALIPYLFVLDHYFNGFMEMREGNEIIAFALMTIAIIAVGMVLENIGSVLEVLLWRRVKKQHPNASTEWYLYLRTAFERDPVAVGYIADIVMRMKFENSFAPALVLLAGGLAWLADVGYIVATIPALWCMSVAVVLAIYLGFESYWSARLLVETRAELLKGVHKL